MNKAKLAIFVSALVLLMTPTTVNLRASIFDFKKQKISSDVIKQNLRASLKEDSEELPFDFYSGEDRYFVDYSLNDTLEDFVQTKIRRYRPQYVSVVVLDNNTGAILTAIDYSKNDDRFSRRLAFSSTHPAASIFKIITAADLLERNKVSRSSIFQFSGRSTTLYKSQVDVNKRMRRMRTQSFEEAFARSNNVIFARAAIQNTYASNLYKTARNFGFQDELLSEVDLGPSNIFMPETTFELAEMASGYNTETTLSPVHGAVVASIVANQGLLKAPHLVDAVIDAQTKENVWLPPHESKRVLSERAALDLREMMAFTVKKGTAKRAFHKGRKAMMEKVIVGGKTGHITGGSPYGRRDWFVSFAIPREKPNDHGISIAVMIVNTKRWTVKSSAIARDIINYYYDDVIDL